MPIFDEKKITAEIQAGKLTELDLSETLILDQTTAVSRRPTLDDLGSVLRALALNNSIRTLNLQKTTLSNNSWELYPLYTMLQTNISIETLDLRETEIKENGIETLVSCLKTRATTLKILCPDGREKNTTAFFPNYRELTKLSPVIPYASLSYGEQVGEGGYSLVSKALWNGKPVALKCFERAKDFEYELKLMARIKSPRVVELHGFCIQKSALVLELMENGSLHSCLYDNKVSFDLKTCITIINDMASALTDLHALHVLHRDFSSLNVLLDKNFRAKLCDFGISKINNEPVNISIGEEYTGPQDSWKAPELFSGQPYTEKSDVYSFGVICCQLFSKKKPLAEVKDNSSISKLLAEKKREEIQEISTECPPKIAKLIRLCWEVDPSKRPSAPEIKKYLESDQVEFKVLTAS